MPTFLITGGTGLIGKALGASLVQQGHQVIILTRNPPDASEIPGIRYARWNVEQQYLEAGALTAADYIIHLAGAGVVAKKWTAAYKKEIVESRTHSSALIFNSLRTVPNRVKAVISVSAIGYYGPDRDATHFFVETDKADDHFLGTTCRLWEESILPVARLEKRLVILRAGIVLSPRGGALAEFIKPVKMGVAAILGNGRQQVSWIHIGDLCRMFLYAAENENINGIFNAVAPEPVSNAQLTRHIARLCKGRFFISLHVPVWVLKLMMGERSVEVLKSARVSSKKMEAAGFKFQFPDIGSALADLLRS